jgi:8-oxo-dGTP pyrophosphatase MutT (NUDIX family)
MLVIKSKRARFTVRVVGVCLRDDHVLLHTGEGSDFWSLPGGRCEMGELSTETLRREMEEETGLHVTVGDLLWVMENLYTDQGKSFHEIGFYYRMELPVDVPPPHVEPEITGMEGAHYLTFRWFPVSELETLRIYPTYFRQALRNLPPTTQHVVHRDVDESHELA